jgi:hypothetical protein
MWGTDYNTHLHIHLRLIQPHSFSCSFIKFTSFPSQVVQYIKPVTIVHYGHILDILPLPADRLNRADSSQPRRQIPSNTEASRFLWLRATTSVKIRTYRSRIRCSSHGQRVSSLLVLQVCQNSTGHLVKRYQWRPDNQLTLIKGVGKGTQAERLLQRFPQLSSISSGDLLRENVKNQTPLGMFKASRCQAPR